MAGLCSIQPPLVDDPNATDLRFALPTGDGGLPSFLILGVVNALEPKLSNLMVPFYQLNSDEDALVQVAGSQL